MTSFVNENFNDKQNTNVISRKSFVWYDDYIIYIKQNQPSTINIIWFYHIKSRQARLNFPQFSDINVLNHDFERHARWRNIREIKVYKQNCNYMHVICETSKRPRWRIYHSRYLTTPHSCTKIYVDQWIDVIPWYTIWTNSNKSSFNEFIFSTWF